MNNEQNIYKSYLVLESNELKRPWCAFYKYWLSFGISSAKFNLDFSKSKTKMSQKMKHIIYLFKEFLIVLDKEHYVPSTNLDEVLNYKIVLKN